MSKRTADTKPNPPPASIVARFRVGEHEVRVTKIMEGRWSAAVDGAELPGTYRTQADAWEVGVREVDARERAAAAAGAAPADASQPGAVPPPPGPAKP